MRTAFIYGLRCPLTGLIRYIGKCDDPKTRLPGHLSDSEKNHRTNWIASLKARKLKPTLEVIAEVASDTWEFWERSYIRAYRQLGFDLVNSTDGGDGVTMTPEIRAKIGVANKGKKLSLETRAKIGARNAGKRPSLEARLRMSAAQTGKRYSPEARAKRCGWNHSLEGRAKISAAQLGRKPKSNTSGFVGVSWRAKKWESKLQKKYIGRFQKIEDAVFVRALAVDKYYGNK